MSERGGKQVPRRIVPSWDDQTSQKDLERYRLLAIELGAADAKVIESGQVILEERVRGKCRIPQCGFYGLSANCPPHSPKVREMKVLLREYRYGIFIKLEIPAEIVAGEKVFSEDTIGDYRRKLYEIISRVESQAYYDGYHVAMAFGTGPCKRTFCSDKECNALLPGKGCRHPLRGRPSMEAVGMDAFRMAARVGWEIYPIGKSVSPADIPNGTFLALVLIY